MSQQESTRSVNVLGDDIEVEWHEAGEGGPTVLFLHGLTGFEPSDPTFASLSRSRRVIAPLHPGYGRTQRPAWMTSIDDVAHYYLELLEENDLDDVTVVGSSVGGWIAATMAAWRPGRISRLVLADPLGIRVGGPLDRDVADLFVVTPEARTGLLFHDTTLAGPSTAEASDDELTRRFQAEEAMALYGWKPYMCDLQLRRRLSSVRIPTLVVWGAEDGLVSPEYGKAYASAFPDAQFDVVAGAGHFPSIERPDEFCALVERFVAGQPV